MCLINTAELCTHTRACTHTHTPPPVMPQSTHHCVLFLPLSSKHTDVHVELSVERVYVLSVFQNACPRLQSPKEGRTRHTAPRPQTGTCSPRHYSALRVSDLRVELPGHVPPALLPGLQWAFPSRDGLFWFLNFVLFIYAGFHCGIIPLFLLRCFCAL